MRNYLRIPVRGGGGAAAPIEEARREDDGTPKGRNRAINIPGRSVRLEKLAGKRKIRLSLLSQPALISINPAAENPSAGGDPSTARRRVGPPLRGPAERP
jgi:hypothetical protein